jgi:hypothetical protein
LTTPLKPDILYIDLGGVVNKTINVYWAPVFETFNTNTDDINSFYSKPETLLFEMSKEKNKDMGDNGHFFSCPASSSYLKNTYVFHSSTDINYEYDFTDENNAIIKSMINTQPELQIMRPPTLKDKPMLFLKLGYIFFAEESLNLTFTPPFLSKPKYLQNGTIFAGTFDVSQWFRPYTMEMQMWEPKGQLIVQKNEPLFYITAETNKQIKLNGFKLNDKLFKYMTECVSAPQWQGKNLPLSKRYEIFKKKKMNEIILSEIKNNLL